MHRVCASFGPVRFLAFLTLFFVSVAGFSSLTLAAETKIAVVNVQTIMSDSLAAKSIQSQLDKQRKSFQEEFSAHERDLLDQEKQLVELRGKLPPEEFEKKGQAYKDEVQRVQKLWQDRRQSLEEAAGKALNELRSQVLDIVAKISDDEKYDLVLSRQNVILSQKEMDITDQVMKQLDKTLKSVPLKLDGKK